MKLKSLLLFLTVMLLTACSHSEQSKLIDYIGDDASVAVTINPEKLARDAGAKDISGLIAMLPVSASRELDAVTELEGIDFKTIAFADYNNEGLLIALVKNMGDLEKSLTKAGYEATEAGGEKVYMNSERIALLIDEPVVYISRTHKADDFVETVSNARRAASTPVADWKRKVLEGDHAINGAGTYMERYFSGYMDIAKQEIKAELTTRDAHGNPKSYIEEDLEFKPLNGDTEYLNTQALVSIAWPQANYNAILERLPRGTMDTATRAIVGGLIKSLKGPIYLSVGFDGNNFSNFQDYSLQLAFATTDKNGAKDIVGTVQTACKGMGFYVKDEKDGFTTRFEGVELNVTAKGDHVIVKSDHTTDVKKPSSGDVKGNLFWASFNVPKKMLKMAEDNAECGLKGTVSSTETTCNIVLQATDTDLTVVEILSGFAR